MLRGASASRGGREKDDLKARLAGLLGMLLRHAVHISDDLAATGASAGNSSFPHTATLPALLVCLPGLPNI